MQASRLIIPDVVAVGKTGRHQIALKPGDSGEILISDSMLAASVAGISGQEYPDLNQLGFPGVSIGFPHPRTVYPVGNCLRNERWPCNLCSNCLDCCESLVAGGCLPG